MSDITNPNYGDRAYLLEKVKSLQERIIYLQDCLIRMTDTVFDDQKVIQQLEERISFLEKELIQYRIEAHEKGMISEYWQSRTHQ